MKKKVVVAGHICLDITPVFPAGKVGALSDILAPGKLIHMAPADVHTGGCVANTGLAMKLLGADVSLAGKVGADAFGEMVSHILEKYDAQEHLLVADGESTAYSVILAIPGIDRIFLHNPGANDTFQAEDIPQALLEGAALFHFGYPPLMKSMYAHNGAALVRLMERAKTAGAATSMDMAAIDPDSEAGAANWRQILADVLPWVDFFVPSAEELCYALDRDRFLQWQARAKGRDVTEILDVEADIQPLAQQCLDLGAKVVLIKCGANGMYFRTGDRARLEQIGTGLQLDTRLWCDQEMFEYSYVPERVLSGTGAGDTSIAAFLTAVLKGYGPEDCLHLAAAAGASCVAAYDALSGLMPLEALMDKIRAGWEKRRPEA